jgi:DNA-binding SARP family transcriptional activator
VVLRVSLLGELSITGDPDPGTGPARVRSARAIALVAHLALHAGSPQPRHRIAGLFWPEPPTRSRRSWCDEFPRSGSGLVADRSQR